MESGIGKGSAWQRVQASDSSAVRAQRCAAKEMIPSQKPWPCSARHRRSAGAGADHDDAGHADDHPQQREEAPELVRTDGIHGEPEGIEKLTPGAETLRPGLGHLSPG